MAVPGNLREIPGIALVSFGSKRSRKVFFSQTRAPKMGKTILKEILATLQHGVGTRAQRVESKEQRAER